MAGRFYLAPIIGTGTDIDPFRAKTADIVAAAGVGHVAHIPSRPDGTPRFAWCVVRAPNVAAIRDDPDHQILPALATLWQDLTPAQQQAAQTAFSSRFGLTLVPDPGDSVLDVIRALGRALEGHAGVDLAAIADD